MSIRRFLTIAISTCCILSALPATAASIALTKAEGSSVDTPGEVTGNTAGFVMGWIHNVLSPSLVSEIRARQFGTTGRAVGKQLVFDQQALSLLEPKVLPAGTNKVAAFWFRPGSGVMGRLGNTATGALEAEKPILTAAADQPSEAIMDAVALDGGRFALLTYRFDFSNSFSKRVAITILGADLRVIKGPTFLPGPKASYVATAARDFAVAPLKNGGALVVYRNRVDGFVYAVPVSAAGAVPATATRLSQKSMPLGTGGQQTVFEVDVARLTDGRLVAVWTRLGQSDSDDAFDIQYRLLTTAGKPSGVEKTAHASVSEEQVAPEVQPLAAGRFAISWVNNGGPVEGRPRSYVVRVFKSTGGPAGSAKTVFTGDRQVNNASAELTPMGSRLLVIRAANVLPQTIEGFALTP